MYKNTKLSLITTFFLLIANISYALEGDMNCDGVVNFDDFFLLADDFGKTTAVDNECAGSFTDMNCDGAVNFDDFFQFADNFGNEGKPSDLCFGDTSGQIDFVNEQEVDEATSSVAFNAFHAPVLMADILKSIRTIQWNKDSSQIQDLAYVSIGVAGTSNLVILKEDQAIHAAEISIEEGMTSSTDHSNDRLLNSTFKLIEVGIDTYMIVSAKHFNYAIDFHISDDSKKLTFRDYRSYYSDPETAAFLTFTFTQSNDNTLIKASGRHVYDTNQGGFVEDLTWTSLNAQVNGSSIILSEQDGSNFTFFAPTLSLGIPSDFNPLLTARVSNDELIATWDGSDRIESSLKDISSQYASQTSVAGLNESTTTEANNALSAIDSILTSEGASLRYPIGFYETVRDNMLQRKIEVSDLHNSSIGKLTIPYVIFTNESDSEGSHHPFMVIMSYGVTEGMTGLWDVPRPPGSGEAGTSYSEQTVTRNANLGAIFAKIPMKDYGLTESLTENIMISDLASDFSESNLTVLNYASVSATGIAIDGVLIYPAYNNTLEYASLPGEISNVGIHSGRGLGLHYHADAHGANSNGLNIYNDGDYTDYAHPPIISLGFDGIAGYARYTVGDSLSEGIEIDFDQWGGHDHDAYKYHYHAEQIEVTETDSRYNNGEPVNYNVHTFPPKGAWRGKINDIPGFWGNRAPAYSGRPGAYQGFD